MPFCQKTFRLQRFNTAKYISLLLQTTATVTQTMTSERLCNEVRYFLFLVAEMMLFLRYMYVTLGRANNNLLQAGANVQKCRYACELTE